MKQYHDGTLHVYSNIVFKVKRLPEQLACSAYYHDGGQTTGGYRSQSVRYGSKVIDIKCFVFACVAL